MQKLSDSKKYRFLELLSENTLVQTWFAYNIISEQLCIVKVPSTTADLNNEIKLTFLERSFDSQQCIKSHKITTAIGKTVENGIIQIEYPYLNPKRWRNMTSDDFWRYFPVSLIQVCIIVDYLHFLDLVHCDLKLSNFLIDTSSDDPKITLIDLDFLCPEGTSAQAKIFGTPKHIAPELFDNRKIGYFADNYSLGIILSDCINYLEGDDSRQSNEISSVINNINDLVSKLITKQPTLRPSILINSLEQYKIIDKKKVKIGQKTLLTALLVSKYWTEKKLSLRKKKGLNEFLHSKNNIFGLHDEFVTDLNLLLKKNQLKFLMLFKQLIEKSEITMYEHYWQFDVSDSLLNLIYEQADTIYSDCKLITSNRNFYIESVLEIARDINRSGKSEAVLKSFLILQNSLDLMTNKVDSKKKNTKIEILRALSILTGKLGRIDDSIKYLTCLLELLRENNNDALKIIYRLSFLEMAKHRFKKSEEWIGCGLTFAKKLKNIEIQEDLLRLKAWILSQRGENDQSKKLLFNAEKIAKKNGYDELLSKVYHDIGMLYRREGDFLRAEKFLLKSAKIYKILDLKSGLSSIYGNLSVISFEQSNYRKAIEYGELALNAADQVLNNTIVNNVFLTLAVANSRLNNSYKVAYWLEKIKVSDLFKNSRVFKQRYYLCKGTAESNLGDYQKAKDSLNLGKYFTHPDDPQRYVAESEAVLAEIALYQSNSSSCLEHIENSKVRFSQLQDSSSLAEIDLIEKLNNEINLGIDQRSELISILKNLIQSRCHLFAATCLLYILISKKGNDISSALKTAAPLSSMIKSGDIPIYKAIAQLVNTRGNLLRKRRTNVSNLKKCYRILDSSGQKFFAYFLCNQIADHYLINSQIKLSAAFLKHSRQIADTLNNTHFSEISNDKLSELDAKSAETFLVQKTIFGISEILNEIDDYESAVNKLLDFVIEEVGAERGALLLASTDNPGKLKIKSSVNCDKKSLKDIESISRSIPAYVSKQQKPLIIDDAQYNKRTKEFRSIVIHNIRSVICIPITNGGNNIGVLYLDHHTIPGLFDVGDIMFVKSIANFISIVLSSLQNYRDADMSRQQLKRQLEDLGIKNKIVYRSKIMSELIDKLPDIAKSKASVLIMGESCTGKELVCDYIHKVSARASEPLVILNSSAIASTLIESELFGVARKVATEVEPRDGKFSAADGGTLFLDEIGDMPIEIQAKILRVVEEQVFEKVGSNISISVDIRFIYATNKDIKKLIEQDKFREDLYHRINTIEIVVPPLRERPEDIPELVNHFMNKFLPDENERPTFSEGAMHCMLSYRWPGNIRELRNLVERICILQKGDEIKIKDLPISIAESTEADSDLLLNAKIYELLQQHKGNQSKVASILEIPLSTLRRKIKKFNLDQDI
ncbi:MAG: tetratricopeptide repeat protein [candidate division Zixibacteria bacterium]|nr:tetratricopeptide repeat protein [candidate division Zixibacteria bacterium]